MRFHQVARVLKIVSAASMNYHASYFHRNSSRNKSLIGIALFHFMPQMCLLWFQCLFITYLAVVRMYVCVCVCGLIFFSLFLVKDKCSTLIYIHIFMYVCRDRHVETKFSPMIERVRICEGIFFCTSMYHKVFRKNGDEKLYEKSNIVYVSR